MSRRFMKLRGGVHVNVDVIGVLRYHDRAMHVEHLDGSELGQLDDTNFDAVDDLIVPASQHALAYLVTVFDDGTHELARRIIRAWRVKPDSSYTCAEPVLIDMMISDNEIVLIQDYECVLWSAEERSWPTIEDAIPDVVKIVLERKL